MSGTISPPKVVTETFTITTFTYILQNFEPHHRVEYTIQCFNGLVFVKTITGVLEGEEYKRWVDDDWLDAFMKSKVEAL